MNKQPHGQTTKRSPQAPDACDWGKVCRNTNHEVKMTHETWQHKQLLQELYNDRWNMPEYVILTIGASGTITHRTHTHSNLCFLSYPILSFLILFHRTLQCLKRLGIGGKCQRDKLCRTLRALEVERMAQHTRCASTIPEYQHCCLTGCWALTSNTHGYAHVGHQASPTTLHTLMQRSAVPSGNPYIPEMALWS